MFTERSLSRGRSRSEPRSEFWSEFVMENDAADASPERGLAEKKQV